MLICILPGGRGAQEVLFQGCLGGDLRHSEVHLVSLPREVFPDHPRGWHRWGCRACQQRLQSDVLPGGHPPMSQNTHTKLRM